MANMAARPMFTGRIVITAKKIAVVKTAVLEINIAPKKYQSTVEKSNTHIF